MGRNRDVPADKSRVTTFDTQNDFARSTPLSLSEGFAEAFGMASLFHRQMRDLGLFRGSVHFSRIGSATILVSRETQLGSTSNGKSECKPIRTTARISSGRSRLCMWYGIIAHTRTRLPKPAGVNCQSAIRAVRQEEREHGHANFKDVFRFVCDHLHRIHQSG